MHFRLYLFYQHPTRRSKRHIACSDFFYKKVRVRSFRCSSFSIRKRCAGLRVEGTGVSGGVHLFHQYKAHRSKPCIACSDFFQKVRVRSRRCFSFPNRTRSIGLRFGGASAGRNALILIDCRETTVSPTDCEQTVRSVLLLCKGNRRAGEQRARCPVFRA